MSLRLQPVHVATGSHDTEGQLDFSHDVLVAVPVRLSDEHGDESGRWFLETGFGQADDPSQHKFANQDEAQDRIMRRLADTTVHG